MKEHHMKPIGLTDNCIGKPVSDMTPKPVRGHKPGPVSLPKGRQSAPAEPEGMDDAESMLLAAYRAMKAKAKEAAKAAKADDELIRNSVPH